jgi:hypothetical protein
MLGTPTDESRWTLRVRQRKVGSSRDLAPFAMALLRHQRAVRPSWRRAATPGAALVGGRLAVAASATGRASTYWRQDAVPGTGDLTIGFRWPPPNR